jgi:hypothetical protein
MKTILIHELNNEIFEVQ